jgi:hypothetical protein
MMDGMENSAKLIRKQVYLLSIQDLIDHPIWEFCSDEADVDGQDEATVRPSEEREVPGFSPGAYVVAADAVLGDGTSVLGYLYSGEPSDMGCIQPNILAGSSQVNFWLGWLRFITNKEERIANNYALLGKSRESIFPIAFRSRANINGEPLIVSVEGFMALDLDRHVKVLG